MTAAGLSCGSCGTQLGATAKFCSACGTPVSHVTQSAEYKQVTVLFADVVHSVDIAAAVGAERLREIMAEVLDRSAAVVRRYGGMVDKFTGDGIMAVFGAPVSLEDHALRACLAALEIQGAIAELSAVVRGRDGVVALQLALRARDRVRCGAHAARHARGVCREVGGAAECGRDRLRRGVGSDPPGGAGPA